MQQALHTLASTNIKVTVVTVRAKQTVCGKTNVCVCVCVRGEGGGGERESTFWACLVLLKAFLLVSAEAVMALGWMT
jgi:hypothetical protein